MSGKDDTEMFSTPTFFYIPSKNSVTPVLLPQNILILLLDLCQANQGTS